MSIVFLICDLIIVIIGFLASYIALESIIPKNTRLKQIARIVALSLCILGVVSLRYRLKEKSQQDALLVNLTETIVALRARFLSTGEYEKYQEVVRRSISKMNQEQAKKFGEIFFTELPEKLSTRATLDDLADELLRSYQLKWEPLKLEIYSVLDQHIEAIAKNENRMIKTKYEEIPTVIKSSTSLFQLARLYSFNDRYQLLLTQRPAAIDYSGMTFSLHFLLDYIDNGNRIPLLSIEISASDSQLINMNTKKLSINNLNSSSDPYSDDGFLKSVKFGLSEAISFFTLEALYQERSSKL